MQVCGINPVLEALKAKRATLIRVSPRADDRLTHRRSRKKNRGGSSVVCAAAGILAQPATKLREHQNKHTAGLARSRQIRQKCLQ